MRIKKPTSEWDERSKNIMAQGWTGTNSRRSSQYVRGVFPSHINSGYGPYLIDAFGNRYIDFVSGLGSIILGYRPAQVVDAVCTQISRGVSHSLPTTLEVEVAEQLSSLIPAAQKIRFLKTGSEATSAALRIARLATGRALVLSRGYHGHSDIFTSLSAPSLGVVDKFNIKAFKEPEEITNEVAAGIVEAIELDGSDKWWDYLKRLREACDKTGAVLIFDEVITGFRVPKFTVSNWKNIQPDIICLGKAIANGFPLSVVAGKREVMDCGEYFISSTFSGEAASLAAAQQVLTIIETKKNLEALWFYGDRLRTNLNALFPEVVFEGYGTRGMLNTTNPTTALFMQEACKAGILFGKAWFFNFAHLEENIENFTLSVCASIAERIKRGEVQLEGKMPEQPFVRKDEK